MNQTMLAEPDHEDDWAALRERSQKAYKADVVLDREPLTQNAATKNLLARLETIMVETAKIGNGKRMRARVYRAGEPPLEMFDTEECLTTTCKARLHRFLSQQIVLEATRCAG